MHSPQPRKEDARVGRQDEGVDRPRGECRHERHAALVGVDGVSCGSLLRTCEKELLSKTHEYRQPHVA